GATRSGSANQQGVYSVPALLPGPHNIRVEANGFKTVHQNGVVIESEQQAPGFHADHRQPGREHHGSGERAAAQHPDASASTLIGNRFVDNMPLNGRSFSSLIDLA